MAPRFIDVIEWLDLVRRSLLNELARVDAAAKDPAVGAEAAVALHVRAGLISAQLNTIQRTSLDVTERWIAGTLDESGAARELAALLRRTGRHLDRARPGRASGTRRSTRAA